MGVEAARGAVIVIYDHTVLSSGPEVPQKLCFVVASSRSVKFQYFVYAFSFMFPGRNDSGCPSPFYFAHWPQRDLRHHK